MIRVHAEVEKSIKNAAVDERHFNMKQNCKGVLL